MADLLLSFPYHQRYQWIQGLRNVLTIHVSSFVFENYIYFNIIIPTEIINRVRVSRLCVIVADCVVKFCLPLNTARTRTHAHARTHALTHSHWRGMITNGGNVINNKTIPLLSLLLQLLPHYCLHFIKNLITVILGGGKKGGGGRGNRYNNYLRSIDFFFFF